MRSLPITSWPAILLAALPALGTTSCSADGGESTSEDVASVAEPVVVGMSNVTNGQTPNSTYQSETASAAIGNGVAIAYNTDDSAHGVVSVHYCRNYSGQAVTYRVTANGAWQTLRIPTGASKALLIGDPAIAVRNDPDVHLYRGAFRRTVGHAPEACERLHLACNSQKRGSR